MVRDLARRPGRGVWWLSPFGALTLVVPATLVIAARLDDADYRLFWRTPKVLTTDTVWLVALAAGVLVVGSLVGAVFHRSPPRAAWPHLEEAQWLSLRRASTVVFVLTVVGYLAFAVAGALRGLTPAALVAALTSQDNYSGALKEQLGTIPGVTTLTQCGIAYVVIACVLLMHRRDAVTARRLVVVLLLALLRAFVNTERLALLELVVPAVAVVAMGMARRGSGGNRPVVALLPIVLLPAVGLVFAAFEYSRSWQFFSSRTSQSFPEFVITRIAGYYATAYNNGQLRLDHAGHPGRLPYESIQVFWDAPIISQLDLYGRLSAPPTTASTSILEAHGNPEFNNPGGLLVPLVDFGTVGGLAFFLVMGLLIGWAYASFVGGGPGVLFYPTLLTGLLDIPRYVYWTQGRLLPAVVCLVVVAVLLQRGGRRPGRGPDEAVSRDRPQVRTER